jgi:hypothetical protein
MKLEVQAVSTDQTLLHILHFPCFGLAIVMSSMCAADDDDALSDLVKSTFMRCTFYCHYDAVIPIRRPVIRWWSRVKAMRY